MKRSRCIFGVLAILSAILSHPQPALAVSEGTAFCEATFPAWPVAVPSFTATCGEGSLPIEGLAFGVASFGAHGLCVPSCSFAAEFDSYDDVCIPELPIPAIGFGTGTILVRGASVGGFEMTRLGLVTIYLPRTVGSFAGVGTFVPETPIPTCAVPSVLRAHMTWQE